MRKQEMCLILWNISLAVTFRTNKAAYAIPQEHSRLFWIVNNLLLIELDYFGNYCYHELILEKLKFLLSLIYFL